MNIYDLIWIGKIGIILFAIFILIRNKKIFPFNIFIAFLIHNTLWTIGCIVYIIENYPIKMAGNMTAINFYIIDVCFILLFYYFYVFFRNVNL